MGLFKNLKGAFSAMTAGAAEGNRLREVGVPAEAKLDAVQETGMTVQMGGPEMPVAQFQLTVLREGMEPYQVLHRQAVPRLSIGLLVPGTTLPCKVDPDDPSKLVILFEGGSARRGFTTTFGSGSGSSSDSWDDGSSFDSSTD
jgi:hypothetical protein